MGMLRPTWSDATYIIVHLAIHLCFMQFPIYIEEQFRTKSKYQICFKTDKYIDSYEA